MSPIILLLVAIVMAVVIAKSVRFVPKDNLLLVARLGVQRRTLPSGMHLLIPVVDAPIGTFAESDLRVAHVDVDARTSDQRPVRCRAAVRYATSGGASDQGDPTDLATRIVTSSFAQATSSDVRLNTDQQLEHFLRSELDDAFTNHGMQVIDVRLTSFVRP